MAWFKRKQSGEHPLRTQSLGLTAAVLGLSPTHEFPRYFGVLMDQQLPVGTFTLAAFAEGSVSLYWGAKGGIIGAGEHQHVRDKAMELLTVAHLIDESLPGEGEVHFTLKGYERDVSFSTSVKAILATKDNVYSLYAAAQDVITEIRLLQQRR